MPDSDSAAKPQATPASVAAKAAPKVDGRSRQARAQRQFGDPTDPQPAVTEPPNGQPAAETEEQLRARIRAELEEEMRGSTPGVFNAPPALDEPAPEVVVPEKLPPEVKAVADGKAVVIHILVDGFNCMGKIRHRGEEIIVLKDSPEYERNKSWLGLDKWGQLDMYGVEYFGQGPWGGAGFDTSDDTLSEAQRNRLLEANRRSALLKKVAAS